MVKLKCLLFGALLLFVHAAGAQNLLVNPSFETGDLSGWDIVNGIAGVGANGTLLPGSTTSIIRARTGGFALYGNALAGISQGITPLPGQNYVFGFYALQGTAPATAEPIISVGGVAFDQIETIPASSLPTNFSTIQEFYTAPAGQAATTVFFYPGGLSISYDDFFFQPYTPKTITSGQTTRMLINGDPVLGVAGASFSFSNAVPQINNSGLTLVNVSTTIGQALALSDGKTTKPIVGPNQTAPDGNGILVPNSDPALNQSGQAAFGASLINTAGGTADNYGVFLYNGSSVITIARKGQLVPGGNGTIASATKILLNDQGKVFFDASLSGTAGGSADNQALFINNGASLIKLARSGDLTPSGTFKFNGFSSLDPGAINALGQVAFSADTVPAGGGAVSSGLFLYDGSTVTELPRSGQTLDNQTWSAPGHVALTDSGKIVFDGKIGATSGILLRSGNTVQVLAQAGKAAPDGNGAFSALSDSATASSTAQVAFRATLTGTAQGAVDNSGIYRAGPEGMIKIARAGQTTPENDGKFTTFDPNPSINANGLVAFVAQNSTGSNDSEAGIYVGDGRDLLMVTRFGYAVDGAIVNGASAQTRVPPAINSMGQVAYQRVLSDGLARILTWTPTLHWRSPVSGDWSNSDNWTLGLAPAAPHTVMIDPAAPTTVAGPAGVTTIQSLTLGGVAAARLGLAPASNLTVTGDATVNTTGTLGVQLAGSVFDSITRQYSRLSVGGNAALSGTLDVTRAAGFTPQLGDTFDVLTYGTHTGQFNSITGVDAGANLALAAVYLPDRLEIVAALPGDANLDHSVGFSDLVTVAQHYGASGQSWVTGDFTGDGNVGFEDLVKVAQNYGGSFPPVAVAGASADFQADMAAAFASVPEPAVGSLLLLAMPLLRRRR